MSELLKGGIEVQLLMSKTQAKRILNLSVDNIPDLLFCEVYGLESFLNFTAVAFEKTRRNAGGFFRGMLLDETMEFLTCGITHERYMGTEL